MGKKKKQKKGKWEFSVLALQFFWKFKSININRKFILNETILRDLNNSLFILCTLSHVILILKKIIIDIIRHFKDEKTEI